MVRKNKLVKAVAGFVAAAVVGLVPVATATPAQAAPDHYSPPSGVRFNNPYGDFAKRRNNVRHIIRTINSMNRHQFIRIMSWNLRSASIANALIAAQHRGVTVRVIMDHSNHTPDNPNRDIDRLIAAFKDPQRKPHFRSWLHQCLRSCRGKHGIAHTKFYLFSKVADRRKVIMYGSTNATDLSASIQWNDLYTIGGHPKIYDKFKHVFNQASRDHAVPQGYVHGSGFDGRFHYGFYPYTGKGTSQDPTLKVLNSIRCQGSTIPGAGGHTRIRIAQTAMYGDRGIAIANRLVTMHNRGCDIRIVYAMFGNEVLHILRHGGPTPVPLEHLALDSNDDGIYDRYVHMKDMAVAGVVGHRTGVRITWNGSSNWTPVSLASDEVLGKIHDSRITKKYIIWINHLFENPPAGFPTPGTVGRDVQVQQRARTRGVDPYQLIKQDL